MFVGVTVVEQFLYELDELIMFWCFDHRIRPIPPRGEGTLFNEQI